MEINERKVSKVAQRGHWFFKVCLLEGSHELTNPRESTHSSSQTLTLEAEQKVNEVQQLAPVLGTA